MHVQASLVIAAAAVLGSAAQDTAVTISLTSVHSGSPIQYGAVNAANAGFHIGGPGPNTTCPESSCPSGPNDNTTIISINPPTGSAILYSLVPGGQDVFVAPDGSLSFTEAHVEAVYPPGSISTGFVYNPPVTLANGAQSPATLGFTGNGSTGWVACPTPGTYPYQVFAAIPALKLPADCVGFDAVATNQTGDPQVYEYV